MTKVTQATHCARSLWLASLKWLRHEGTQPPSCCSPSQLWDKNTSCLPISLRDERELDRLFIRFEEQLTFPREPPEREIQQAILDL